MKGLENVTCGRLECAGRTRPCFDDTAEEGAPDMDYIRQLNAFSGLSAATLSSNEVNVYLRLFWRNNQERWVEWFEMTDARLQVETGIGSPNTLREIRSSLRQKGFIDFIPGKRRKPTRYKIIDLCRTSESSVSSFISTGDIKTDTDIKTDIKTDVKTDIKTDSIYKHKRKTETKTKKEKQKEKAAAFSLDSYTQNAELLEALDGFVEMRKKAKAPLTERALALLLKKLDGLGHSDAEKVEIVNQSVMNNWKGLFPLKQEMRQHGTGRDNSREALEERYQDFLEADRDYTPPWKLRPPSGGDQASSG